MACFRCGGPSHFKFGLTELCQPCYTTIQLLSVEQQRQRMAMINHLLGMAELSVGLPGLFPRIDIPQPPAVMTGPANIMTGPTNYNLNIDRSVIGTVNTGIIHQLEVSMTDIHNMGHADVASNLKQFIDEIGQSQALSVEQRQEILERLDFLALQARTQGQSRLRKMGLEAISAISSILTTASVTSQYWPALQDFFGKLFQ